MDRSLRIFWLLACAGIVCGAGCVSRKRAQAEARAAYMAGQRDALAGMQRQPQNGDFTVTPVTPQVAANITIVGPVQNPVVQWRNGLTLAQAILNAVYQSPSDPTQIVIKRSNEEIRVEPAQLLNGVDIPLLPGDVVLIQVPAA